MQDYTHIGIGMLQTGLLGMLIFQIGALTRAVKDIDRRITTLEQNHVGTPYPVVDHDTAGHR